MSAALSAIPAVTFNAPDLGAMLSDMDDAAFDALDFGVIGFGADTTVQRYNAFEARAAALRAERVLGLPLFATVAPCMNNFMVAQRFDDAAANGSALDVTIDYVLTLRMRPTKVALRLLALPGQAMRYVLVHRL